MQEQRSVPSSYLSMLVRHPFVIFLQQRRPTPRALYSQRNRLSATLGQLYLWIYWISQRSKALYFGFVSSRHSLSFDLESVSHAVQNQCGAAATRIEIFRQG